MMLAKDQIRMIAKEIDRTADARRQACEGEVGRQNLWEVVRRASHAIQAVAEIEREDLSVEDRRRRGRYLIAELEMAIDAARRAKVALDWTHSDMPEA